jgi:hypothetical protein
LRQGKLDKGVSIDDCVHSRNDDFDELGSRHDVAGNLRAFLKATRGFIRSVARPIVHLSRGAHLLGSFFLFSGIFAAFL